MQARQAVAIIGAGASGLLTAIQLLRQGGRHGPRVYLIEKQAPFGFGAAYSTSDPCHLLNTRAGNMSGFPDEPRHFLDWLQSHAGPKPEPATPSCFVSRQTFGLYLRSLLRDAVTGSAAAGRLYIVPDEAVSLRPAAAGRFRIRLALGREIEADSAVLAMGNPPPHPPGVADSGVLGSSHYIADPWSCSIPDIAPKDGTVLILGTGLTMVDAVLSLAKEGHRGPIIALSRRGLIPRRHREAQAGEPLPPPPLTSRLTADLRAVRLHIKERIPPGRDWRDVVDALRPVTAAYWRTLPLPDKRRFLRHLRAWWDVHRHRLAPEAADRLEALLSCGALEIRRGRLTGLALTGDESLPVSVTWTPKASNMPMQFKVSSIVNCMGPGNNPRHSPFPLIRQMLQEGLIQADALELGLAVDDKGRVIAGSGETEHLVFALGPVTRGTFWEVTAIPDIRVKAAEVAKAVLAALRCEANADPRPAAASLRPLAF
jgi:uncharacterized NAD(P)/FAD-binding protein YdhS